MICSVLSQGHLQYGQSTDVMEYFSWDIQGLEVSRPVMMGQ